MDNDTKLTRSFTGYVATLLFFGVGAITTIGMEWYDGLVLPAWTPPELLVALIWFVLFVLTACSVAVFWERSKRNERSFASILVLYMENAMLVLLWNYVFFGLHNLSIAFGVAILIGALVVIIMAKVWNEVRLAALLLIPYLLWMLVALALTYQIMLLNP
ncbi:MAG: tryptophan-rich sensory protein [Parcubacteria bacterium C7867-007]|nr:MAG: tryptophan-rich sensory protein [Parcubacteria bacterium C7867-007]